MMKKRTREFLQAIDIVLRQGSGVVFRDSLTGLYNRCFFSEIARKEIARAKRHQRPLVCVLIDIDGLKKINDVYGHQEGDKVLKRLGQLLLETCRESDLPIRWGGDELLLLLPETNETQAKNLLERVTKKSGRVKFSYGVADCLDYDSVEEAISAADQKMYRKKRKTKTDLTSPQ